MNFIKYINNALCTVLCALILTACSDDLEFKNPVTENGEGVITICIPNVDWAAEYGQTRSDEFQKSRAVSDPAEGTINSLWLFAYPVDNKGETKITALSGHNSLNISADNAYKQYQVSNFATGDYHIYLLANFDSYLPSGTLSTNLRESELQKIIVNFTTGKTMAQDNLPMYCLNTDIKKSPTQKVENGIFTISEGSSIYADLKFLCAKLRYTILFDSHDFSYQFSSNNVNFSGAGAENIVNSTKLYLPEPEEIPVYEKTDLFSVSSIDLRPVAYPGPNSQYFNIGTSTTCPDPLANVNSSRWTDATYQRAWQGIIYLPENLSGGDTRTKLSFTPKGTDMEDSYSFQPRELRRAQMYDLVAKLKKTEFDVDLKIADWDLTQLAYNLHGPYELIVESTKLVLTSGEFSTMGYETDVNQIYFDFPTINYTNAEGENMDLPLYVADFIKDGETNDAYGKPYNLSADFDKHFHIRINPLIPFEVLLELKIYHDYTDNKNVTHTVTYTDETGNIHEGSLNYFHIVAGNLHKKIETELNLDAFLNVTPEVIHIQTREYYLGSQDAINPIPIYFYSNYENMGANVDFYLCDPSDLIIGVGCKTDKPKNDLKLDTNGCVDLVNVYEDNYNILVRSGHLNLQMENITAGHDYWKDRHEYTISFNLNVRDPREKSKVLETITKEVKIIVMPFTTNYVIHFYNASAKEWRAPHIFIYQDLLLPADMSMGYNNDDLAKVDNGEKIEKTDYSAYAGKIVGYREYVEGSGHTMNAACQYVFTNNISFRGWYEFGGPEVNNPYDIYPELINNTSSYNREGFIMLGKPGQANGSWIWNNDYGYTNRNKKRDLRYRFDVNFNEDHQRRIDNSESNWSKCGSCYDNYNAATPGSNKNYDYPGVLMETDDDNPGWYRYTLTGVAQPGKTMIVFCDTHAPWNGNGPNDNPKGHADEGWNTVTENRYRYPGANETGLTLFDFEDNEGWFVFKGSNSEIPNITNHFFFDDKADAEAYIKQN